MLGDADTVTGTVSPPHRALYVCNRSQRVHGGAPTGVGGQIALRGRAPEARLDSNTRRRGWAYAPPTPAGAACAALPRSSCLRQVICLASARALTHHQDDDGGSGRGRM